MCAAPLTCIDSASTRPLKLAVVGRLAHDDARRVRLAGGGAGHEVLGRLVAEVLEIEPARLRRRRVERRRRGPSRAPTTSAARRPSARAGCLRSRARGAARRIRRAAGRRRSPAASKTASAATATVRASGRDGMAFPLREGNTLRHGRENEKARRVRLAGYDCAERLLTPGDGVDDAVVLEVHRERGVVPARDRRLLYDGPADGGVALRRRTVGRLDGRHRHAGLRPQRRPTACPRRCRR